MEGSDVPKCKEMEALEWLEVRVRARRDPRIVAASITLLQFN
jgi:hypothetical protein